MLLHACCAPCACGVAPYFRDLGYKPLLFYFNPNIQPLAEYEKRGRGLIYYAQSEGFSFLRSSEYNPLDFLRHTLDLGADRCTYCYTLRLEQAVKKAKELGYKRFSSTLLISPYQDQERIRLVGHNLAKLYQLEFLAPDLVSLYSQSRDRAQELNLYRQTYCGCLSSEYERHFKIEKGAVL